MCRHPDPGSVVAAGATNVIFAGDAVTTNACGLSILRSYQAVNSCGIASNCTQLITVATPTRRCSLARRRFVECGRQDFDPPTAADFCGANLLSSPCRHAYGLSIVGQTFNATRTWLATDVPAIAPHVRRRSRSVVRPETAANYLLEPRRRMRRAGRHPGKLRNHSLRHLRHECLDHLYPALGLLVLARNKHSCLCGDGCQR